MSSKNSLKRTLKVLVVLGVLALTASVALAQDNPRLDRGSRGDLTQRPMPAQIAGAKLDTPVSVDASELAALRLNPELRGATGTQQVVVRLSKPPVAAAAVEGADPAAPGLARAAAKMQQATVVGNARALDPNTKVLATTSVALNSVILEVDASALSQLALNPDVVSINPVRDYELDLSETVPYIGATAVQDMGYDGTGVAVAVLDSGIDYTHIAFGGSGDVNDYLNNDPTIIEPGTFPTAKVVGGYDFVGADWPNGPLAPDPDPLDDGPEGGHGTHVGDIIGGAKGVAPGADLYAVKVCSSVSTSCSGIALLQGMDFALDPNMDNDTSDRVDIINMSLGSTYGDARWDDLSAAVENASALGVLTVASAGNSADKPYVNGTPSGALSALAVAQTSVPSAVQAMLEVTEPANIAGLYAAVFQPWSAPLTSRLEGPVQFGDGAGGNTLGCDPFAPGTLTGKIVLVDRGACAFSVKIDNIGQGGAIAGIIGLVAPGAPFEGGFGGGNPTIPGYMISQSDSNKIKSGLATGVVANFDPANGIPLVQHMVGSSSRGPAFGTNLSKPDIGAPGASVSAVYGTGDGVEPFGGTSGAAPMVSGSAALLMQAYPERSWAEIKALLMNTGETDIMNAPEFFGGYQAAITRIGGGEVRVDRALDSRLAAWDRNDLTGSLSFGFHDVTSQENLVKRVIVRNYGNQPVTIRTEVSYRYDDDQGGEVRLSVPSWFSVPGRGSVSIPVHMFIRPRTDRPLHSWEMNSGSRGANPDVLTLNEYDGYIHFIDVSNSSDPIHMAWQALPRAAGDVQAGVQQTGAAWVRNTGVAETFIDTYSLIGTSPEQPKPVPGGNIAPLDLRYVGVQTYPVPAGFCSDDESFVMSFAVNTWDRQTHAVASEFDFYLDTDNDGTYDYVVFNYDLALPGITDGRNVTWVADLSTGLADAWFFTTHYTNSANTVLTFCGEQIGMNAEDFLVSSMAVDAFAYDLYWTGTVTDAITGMNVVPLGERYFTVFENGDFGYTELPARSGKLGFGVLDFGDQLNATETGLLWLYGPGATEANEVKAWMFQP